MPDEDAEGYYGRWRVDARTCFPWPEGVTALGSRYMPGQDPSVLTTNFKKYKPIRDRCLHGVEPMRARVWGRLDSGADVDERNSRC